jgi:hypothetical protein
VRRPRLATALSALAILAVAGVVSGCATMTRPGVPAGIVMVGSSWVTGQPSLAASPLFDAIENRAASLGEARWSARQLLLAQIVAAKRAAEIRARQALLRKYAQERARELARYRAELLKIQRERAAALAKERAAKLKYARELAAYMKARTVTPGQECADPLVRRYYRCSNGLLPAHPGKRPLR